MSLTRVWVRGATLVVGGAVAISAATTPTPAAAPVAGYQPLAFLVGHCWKGTFPASSVRSRWARTASDAYEVVTEFQENDRWLPGFTVHMQRVHD